ncbi:MAG: AAA family ATPase [Bdellovibrionales bacterium]|nr:AAA family ATPase [Bdellovibrionales bacterium]
MKVLIVDSTTEGQAQCAERIAEVRDVHLGGCQIDIRLADTKNYRSKISDCDLLILGPELGESAAAVATHVRSSIPHVQILMFVSEAAYAANSFQLAISAGIKRVLSENSSQLDVLQELVAIQSALCKSGRLKSAKIIVVKSVKGGAGATSVAAALAEISSDHGTNVLLWDLDTETRDLSRALSGDLALGQAFEKWLEAPHSIDREQLKRALCPIAENAHLLPPPSSPYTGIRFSFDPEGTQVALRILEVARNSYDLVIIDAGKFSGPTFSTLARQADRVLFVVGDCPLGASALDAYFQFYPTLIDDPRKVSFLTTSPHFSPESLRSGLPSLQAFPESSWMLPLLAYDEEASRWAGNRSTLYSMGNELTQLTLVKIARAVGALPANIISSTEDSGLHTRMVASKPYGLGFLHPFRFASQFMATRSYSRPKLASRRERGRGFGEQSSQKPISLLPESLIVERQNESTERHQPNQAGESGSSSENQQDENLSRLSFH